MLVLVSIIGLRPRAQAKSNVRHDPKSRMMDFYSAPKLPSKKTPAGDVRSGRDVNSGRVSGSQRDPSA